jgi:hypothetical protein
MATDWRDYIDAARRKISIASFHADQLDRALSQTYPGANGRPPIVVQAFFEGVVIAVIAAIDQVAQATNSALRLGLLPGNLFERAFQEIEALVPEFKAWRENPIGVDLRRVRTRMMHYSYMKSPSGQPSWKVESANDNYRGSRELSHYAKAAVEYADELRILSGKLENALSSSDESQT